MVIVKTDYLSHWRYNKEKDTNLLYVGYVWKKARNGFWIPHSKSIRLSSIEFYREFSLKILRPQVLVTIRELMELDKDEVLYIVCDEKEENGCSRQYYANYFDNILNTRKLTGDAERLIKKMTELKEKSNGRHAFVVVGNRVVVKDYETKKIAEYKVVGSKIYKLYDWGLSEEELVNILLDLLVG